METKKVVNLPVHIFENRAQMGVAAAADAAKRINAIIEKNGVANIVFAPRRCLSAAYSRTALAILIPSKVLVPLPISSKITREFLVAFFKIFALKRAVIFSGREPSNSVARATHNDTAIGSVQPMAGTTSRFIIATIASRISFDNIKFNL